MITVDFWDLHDKQSIDSGFDYLKKRYKEIDIQISNIQRSFTSDGKGMQQLQKETAKLQQLQQKQNKALIKQRNVKKSIIKTDLNTIETEKRLSRLNKQKERALKQQLKLEERQKKQTKEYIRVKERERIEMQKTKREQKLLIKFQQAEKGSIERLQAATNILVNKRKQLNLSTQRGQRQYAKLTRQIKKNTVELKQHDAAISRHQRNVGNYSSAFGKLRTSVTALTGAFAAASGIIMALIAFDKKLMKTAKLQSKLRFQFGATNKNVKQLTVSAMNLASAIGGDVSESIEAANVFYKEFSDSITKEQAFELIKSAAEKGANANGRLLELLKEYPAQLRQVGYSAQESLAIITETERMGVFSDKGIDAIKEFGIRIRELKPATRKALKGIELIPAKIEKSLRDGSKNMGDILNEVSAKLAVLEEDSPEVGAALADIFGGAGEDAGLRYLTQLKDINTNFSELKTQLTDAEIAQQRLNEAYNEFIINVTTSGNALGNFFIEAKEKIAEVFETLNLFLTGDWGVKLKILANTLVDALLLAFKPFIDLYEFVSGDDVDIEIFDIEEIKKAERMRRELDKVGGSLAAARSLALSGNIQPSDGGLMGGSQGTGYEEPDPPVSSGDSTAEMIALMRKMTMTAQEAATEQMNAISELESKRDKELQKVRERFGKKLQQTEEFKHLEQAIINKYDVKIAQAENAQLDEQQRLAVENFKEKQKIQKLDFDYEMILLKRSGVETELIEKKKKEFKLLQLREYLKFLERNMSQATEAELKAMRNLIAETENEMQKLEDGEQDGEKGMFGQLFDALKDAETEEITSAIKEIYDSKLFDEASKATQTFTAAFIDAARRRIEALNNEYEASKRNTEQLQSEKQGIIEKAKQAESVGAASTKREIDRINREIEVEKEKQRELDIARKKEARRIKAIQVAKAVGTTALNVIKALGAPPIPGVNFVAAALAAAAGAAQIANIKAQKFHDGEEFVTGKPGRDKIPAWIERGERVVPAYENSMLHNIPNAELPDAVNYYIKAKQGGTDNGLLSKIEKNTRNKKNKTLQVKYV